MTQYPDRNDAFDIRMDAKISIHADGDHSDDTDCADGRYAGYSVGKWVDPAAENALDVEAGTHVLRSYIGVAILLIGIGIMVRGVFFGMAYLSLGISGTADYVPGFSDYASSTASIVLGCLLIVLSVFTIRTTRHNLTSTEVTDASELASTVHAVNLYYDWATYTDGTVEPDEDSLIRRIVFVPTDGYRRYQLCARIRNMRNGNTTDGARSDSRPAGGFGKGMTVAPLIVYSLVILETHGNQVRLLVPTDASSIQSIPTDDGDIDYKDGIVYIGCELSSS